MSTKAPAWGGWRLSLGLTTVGVCVLGLTFLGSPVPWLVIVGYAALVLITAAALHRGSGVPGSLLGRRAVRRSVVAVQGAICVALLLGALWASTAGQALLISVLVLLDVTLGRATQRVATAPDAAVDEREEAVRNRAHVHAYRLLAVAVAVVAAILVVGTAASPARWSLAHILTPGGVAACVQLLFGLPAMMLAWSEPDRLAPEPGASVENPWPAISLVLLAVTIATPFLLSLTPALLPPRISATTSPPRYGPAVAAADLTGCREFLAGATVGVGVEARIPLHAEACWDGHRAYEVWGMNRSDCTPAVTMLATVTPARCSRVTAPDGTLAFTYRAFVRPTLLPFLVRDVDVRVVVNRHGDVERFP